MSTAIIALALGTLLAVGALAFVLYPLFFPSVETGADRPRDSLSASASSAGGPSETDRALVALREIEFDRATGKLSEADYAQLKARYTGEALLAMRQRDELAAEPALATDAVEAAISAYRARHPACSACGPRPEMDAIFCSSCGRYLPGACERCGARVDEPGARFCAACGHRLAA